MALFGKKLRTDGRGGLVANGKQLHFAAVTRNRGDKPVVSGLRSFSLDGDELDSGALRQALERNDLRLPISTLLDYPDYQLLLVEAPDVRPDELRSAVRWRIKDLISFHIDDAIIDVFEIPDQRHQHRNRMMYAVAAKARAVQDRAQQLEEAGLSVAVVDIPEMALRNLAMLLPTEKNGVALLHLEEDRGIITISRQGTLFLTRRWDVGLRELRAAEEAFQREGLFDNILLEVQRSLDYYDSHFPHGTVAEIALTPAAYRTEGLADYINSQISRPCRELAVNELLEGCGDVTDNGELMAIGAALRFEERSL
ncbi:MAG: pilus assembly protein PilM [Gammaproteobacteria bacterium]|nr:pilus assembly protein PilM [Gammaproteobacteria bacterium]